LLISLTARCARRRGTLAGVLAALVSVAAAAPCLQAAASAHSHRSHTSHSEVSPEGPPSGGPRNWLTSADGTLHTPVGVYSDCSGAAPVPTDMAAVDTCVRDRVYFVGHNAGVFTPLMHMGLGSLITWYDGSGRPHVFKVVGVRDAPGGARPMIAPQRRLAAQFQTCETPDGSVDRLLDAVRS
jgi:hypothetical protein